MNQEQFAMAQQLASMAEELDYAKNSFDMAMKHASISCVRELHILAQALAGERVGEIYAPSDEVVA